jgi:UDP-N-acetylmuramate dehydrogenase
VSDLIELLKKVSRGDVQEQVPLDHRTSVRVGGAAKLLVRPKDPAALVATLGALSDAGVPWVALGGGANTLVGDGGIDGAVIRIAPDFCTDEIEEQGDGFTLTVGAGAPSGRFVSLVREQNGVGIGSWACGIPGTVGGMVTMNAGTPHGTMSDCLEAVEVATPDGLTWLGADKLKFSYRKCSLPSGAILTRARCKVRRGSEAERAHEQRAIRLDLEKRRASQPLTQPNSGSVFVNPKGNFAGRLIEAAGLKGTKRGGAQISTRHANFIVNAGGATANDVIELILLAMRSVKNATGIELKPEVRLVGTFTPALAPELLAHHHALVCLKRGAVQIDGDKKP